MEVVKNIFSVAQLIYNQCEKAEVNKKCCKRLKSRIQLILKPTEKLEEDPEKSKEMEASLSALQRNLQNAERWVNTYSRRGWWRKILQASGMQKKYYHINEQISNSAQAIQMLINVEHRERFLQVFSEENCKRKNLKDIEEDISTLMQLIKSEMSEVKCVGDKVDSVNVTLKSIQDTLSSGIFRQWDIKVIQATDLKSGDLLEECDLTGESYRLYLGEYLKAPVVIKVLRDNLSGDDEYIRKTFQTESLTMKKYECPNILRLYGICIDRSNTEPCYSLVTEYCEKGTLRELLNREPDLPWERRVLMALDAARALYRLHQTEIKAILHGSLRSSKFLVDGMYCVKLTGFELSKTESSMRRNTVKRCPESSEMIYIAPETMKDINTYNKRSEIYSLGVVIYEIASGKTPLQDFPINEGKFEDIYQQLSVEVDANLAVTCPPVLRDIIKRSLARNPRNRPSAGEIADLLMRI